MNFVINIILHKFDYQYTQKFNYLNRKSNYLNHKTIYCKRAKTYQIYRIDIINEFK